MKNYEDRVTIRKDSTQEEWRPSQNNQNILKYEENMKKKGWPC